jgi:enoyl-CoA hydratase/carnithine racemase
MIDINRLPHQWSGLSSTKIIHQTGGHVEYTTLDYVVRDGYAEITMRREPANAIDHRLIEEILDAYRSAKADDAVRAIILTSAFTKAFSAGMDLEMIRGGSGSDLRNFLSKLYFEMHDLQYRMGKPTIAAVTGPVRAGGVTLAVSCDIIIASETATFGYPEINVGLIPAMHYVHLPQQIGRHKAFEILFTGRVFTAAEAYESGMVTKVVAEAEVKNEARRLAMDFANKSPVIMRLSRDAFMRANDGDYRRTIEGLVDTISHLMETKDAQEGLNAFNEKRKPKW